MGSFVDLLPAFVQLLQAVLEGALFLHLQLMFLVNDVFALLQAPFVNSTTIQPPTRTLGRAVRKRTGFRTPSGAVRNSDKRSEGRWSERWSRSGHQPSRQGQETVSCD